MLSIDFTDSQAKIISGSFKAGTVNVMNSVTVDFEEGLVSGGYVVDIPQVSSLLTTAIKSSQMKEKDLVVTFSSNQIVFKEITVPKAKGDQFNLAVHNQVKSESNISDDYNISFTIIGENVSEDGKETVNVFATACPQSIVDSYVNLASTMGLNLVGVNISSSCVTRIAQNEPSLQAKSPLMIVQVDGSFLSMSIFNNNMIVFSRFVNVDRNEVKLSDDYLARTTYDNVFRMMQFYNSHNEENPIKEVMFYGKVDDADKLLDAVGKLGVDVGLMNQPTTVTAYSGFPFNDYVNAIGALYKRNRDTEHINLLESVSAQSGAQDKLFLTILGVLVLGSLLIIGLAFLYFKIDIGSKEKRIKDIRAYIDSKQEDVARINSEEAELGLLTNYKNVAEHLNEAYKTKPILDNNVLAMVDKALSGKGTIKGMNFSMPNITLTVEYPSVDQASNFAEDLDKLNFFDKVEYTGYTFDGTKATNSVIITVKGGEANAK